MKQLNQDKGKMPYSGKGEATGGLEKKSKGTKKLSSKKPPQKL